MISQSMDYCWYRLIKHWFQPLLPLRTMMNGGKVNIIATALVDFSRGLRMCKHHQREGLRPGMCPLLHKTQRHKGLRFSKSPCFSYGLKSVSFGVCKSDMFIYGKYFLADIAPRILTEE